MPATTSSARLPVRSCSIDIRRHTSAHEVLQDVGDELRARERESNIILPHLLKRIKAKTASSAASSSPEFWLVVRSHSSSRSTVDFILSCTNGPMGTYPIFIWCGRPVRSMSPDFVKERISLLAAKLFESLRYSPRRVYSVFAPAPITRSFASIWSKITNQSIVEEPYYHATFSALDKSTLNREPFPSATNARFSLRKAVGADVSGIADLCYHFASTSAPFTLEHPKAVGEARLLINNDQVYVADVEGKIACLVAVTRSSTKVAAITKVVTHPAFLRQGWAKKLVREVSTRLLYDEQKSSVVLYVARGNKSAENVYHTVGFSGLLCAPSDPDSDSEWLEVGFEDTDLGHW